MKSAAGVVKPPGAQILILSPTQWNEPFPKIEQRQLYELLEQVGLRERVCLILALDNAMQLPITMDQKIATLIARRSYQRNDRSRRPALRKEICKNLKAAAPEIAERKLLCIVIGGLDGGGGIRLCLGIDDRDALVKAGNRRFGRMGHARGTSPDAGAVVKPGRTVMLRDGAGWSAATARASGSKAIAALTQTIAVPTQAVAVKASLIASQANMVAAKANLVAADANLIAAEANMVAAPAHVVAALVYVVPR